jgi:hypothetical protein
MSDFNLSSFRGGMNDSDPPNQLDQDQCVIAENIELWRATLGGKRLGCTNIDLGAANAFADVNNTGVPFLFEHLPSQDLTASELWALTCNMTTQNYGLMRKTTAWTEVTVSDGIKVTSDYKYRLNAASIHGLMFLALKSNTNIDRLHVWDGTSMRYAGLATPVAPTGANTAPVGTFTGTRYYRIRYTVQNGSGQTLRRSEASAALTFAPSGTNTGVTVTKPATISESETHWEIEASIDNANWYRLSTIVVGTTTYTDTFAYGSYPANGTLSADAGDYTVPYSPEYLILDDDRLVMVGAHETSAYSARVSWSVVYGDVTGSGNLERIPIATTNFIDLDTFDKGPVTGVSEANNGVYYVFKQSAIYRFTRTGQRTKAYEAKRLTTKRGALKGSVVDGIDQAGNPCTYFWDAVIGPCRITSTGRIQQCSWDILTTVKTVNLNASRSIHGQFFPDKQQVKWWVATSSANLPNVVVVAHTNLMVEVEQGVRKGFTKWSSGRQTTALCSCMFASNIDSNAARTLDRVPYIGCDNTVDRNFIQKCDTGTTDSGVAYQAYSRSRPIARGGLNTKFGVLAATLLARAVSGAVMSIKILADYGADGTNVKQVNSISMTPTATEPQVERYLDDLGLSDMRSMQIEIGDLSVNSGAWEANQLVLHDSRQDRG